MANTWKRNPQIAMDAAKVKRPCPFCERRIRPCNMDRHMRAQHKRELARSRFDALNTDTEG